MSSLRNRIKIVTAWNNSSQENGLNYKLIKISEYIT